MTENYFDYLSQIRVTGKIYRKYFVYPLIKKSAIGSILDVGCGTGLFLKYSNGAVGVDVNSECVRYCRQNGLTVFEMPYDHLPFEADSFDTIVLDNVLEHIQDPIPILSESRRVLRKHGRIIVLVPGKKGYKKDLDHKNYYSMQSLNNLLRKSRFRILKSKGIPFGGLEKVLSAFCFFSVGEKYDEDS